MKKLLALFVVFAAAACSGSNEPDPNAPTTFVFIHNIENHTLPNCVAGYYADGLCHKIAELGDLSKAGQQTEEIIITDETITDVFFFADMGTTVHFNRTFTLTKNIKNVFLLSEDIRGIRVDKDNPNQYPH